MNLTCPDCQTPYTPGKKFCNKCGRQLPLAQSVPTAPFVAPVESPPTAVLPPVPHPALNQPSSSLPGTALYPQAAPEPVQESDTSSGNDDSPTFLLTDLQRPASPMPVPPTDSPRPISAAPAPPPTGSPRPVPPVPASPTPVATTAFRPAKLIVTRGAILGQEFALNPGTNEIGRWDDESDNLPHIDLEKQDTDGFVHRKHAWVRLVNGQWYIEDAGGANTTRIRRDGQILKVAPGSPFALQQGDEVVVGRVILRFEQA